MLYDFYIPNVAHEGQMWGEKQNDTNHHCNTKIGKTHTGWDTNIFLPHFTKLLLLWFSRKKVLFYREQLFLWLACSIAVQQNFIELQEHCPPLELLQQKQCQFFKTWKIKCSVSGFHCYISNHARVTTHNTHQLESYLQYRMWQQKPQRRITCKACRSWRGLQLRGTAVTWDDFQSSYWREFPPVWPRNNQLLLIHYGPQSLCELRPKQYIFLPPKNWELTITHKTNG